MLSDDEHQALGEIERRLRWESPELVRLFKSQGPTLTKKHRRHARTRALVAAAAIKGVMLLGPRMPTEAEIRTQQRAPLPHTAPFDTANSGQTDPDSGPAVLTAPIEVADVLVAPPTTVATPFCRAS